MFVSILPGCLAYSGNQTLAGHLAELNTADAKNTHISLGTSCNGAAVVLTAGTRVLGESVESGPVAGFL